MGGEKIRGSLQARTDRKARASRIAVRCLLLTAMLSSFALLTHGSLWHVRCALPGYGAQKGEGQTEGRERCGDAETRWGYAEQDVETGRRRCGEAKRFMAVPYWHQRKERGGGGGVSLHLILQGLSADLTSGPWRRWVGSSEWKHLDAVS